MTNSYQVDYAGQAARQQAMQQAMDFSNRNLQSITNAQNQRIAQENFRLGYDLTSEQFAQREQLIKAEEERKMKRDKEQAEYNKTMDVIQQARWKQRIIDAQNQRVIEAQKKINTDKARIVIEQKQEQKKRQGVLYKNDLTHIIEDDHASECCGSCAIS